MDADSGDYNYNIFDEMTRSDNMSRLAAFFTALWLSSVVAQTGFVSILSKTATGVKNQATSEVQAGIDPVGKTLAFVGGGLCKHVKPIVGVAYDNYDEEPDMSKLTLVFQTSTKTIVYNLTGAPEEIPKETWFDSKLPLRVYFHGFTDNPKKNSFQTMSNAFFGQEKTQGKVNILALDSSSLIACFYLRASTMVQFIGEKVGRTLAAMVPIGLDPKKIHLIGHSLGSHIAGFAGKTYLTLMKSRVGRISSLDPAGPCFSNVDPQLRLSKEDADFVDVIHTDAGVYGLDDKVGHVDFWPNSGAEQPGCLLQTCSHSRAWEIYAQSVLTPEAFITVKCANNYDFRHGKCDYNDTSVMGFATPTSTRGSYYCQTSGEEPYSIGAKGLKYKETAVVRSATNAVKDVLFSG